jgi:hypothetical protein
MTAVLVAWAVALAGLALWSVRHDPPTVRDQSPLSKAAPVAASAVGNLVAAAGPSVVPVVSAPLVEAGCRITPLRHGATLTSAVRFYAADGPALLRRLASGLPASYAATASDKSLQADAGEFVAVRGRPTAPGLVQVTVSTGCRPADVALPSAPLAGSLPGSLADEPPRVLTMLGAVSFEPVTSAAAPCPGGRTATTAQAVGHGSPPASLSKALVPADSVVVEKPSTYAFRRGPYAYAVTVTGDEIRAAVTLGC